MSACLWLVLGGVTLDDFKKYYCLDGSFIGKNVHTLKLLYPIYCKLFNIEPVDDIITDICKHDNLAVRNNKLVDFEPTLAKYGY